MKARIDGAWREIITGQIRVGANWKRFVGAWAYVGGAWKEVASFIAPLTGALSQYTVGKGVLGGGSGTTSAVSATPSGGRAPYSYLWVRLTGTANISSTTSASVTFTDSVEVDQTKTSTFRCTITSADGQAVTPPDLTVNFNGIGNL